MERMHNELTFLAYVHRWTLSRSKTTILRPLNALIEQLYKYEWNIKLMGAECLYDPPLFLYFIYSLCINQIALQTTLNI